VTAPAVEPATLDDEPPATGPVTPAARSDDDRARALTVLRGLAAGRDGAEPALLDPRRLALVRIAGLIASGASAVTCNWAAQRARGAGATNAEIGAVLVAIGSTLGASRLVAAAPQVAGAIGYDLEAAFEDPPRPQ
jgi:4-carboxymuconolactone decarboxylase